MTAVTAEVWTIVERQILPLRYCWCTELQMIQLTVGTHAACFWQSVTMTAFSAFSVKVSK